jgi:hypothetical protein
MMAKQTRVNVTSGAFNPDRSKGKCPSSLNGMKPISMVNRISIEESLRSIKFSI